MIKRTIYFALVLVFTLSAFSFYLSNRNRVNAENAAINITAPKYCVDVINEISDTAISEIDTFNLKIEDYINLNESFIIYDFFDYPTAIFYKRLPDGYAIYDYNTNTVLEYSDGDHPYFSDKSQTYYYDGVFNYYIKTKDGFLNLATGSITSADIKHFSFPDDITEVQMDGFPWPGMISYTSSDKIEIIMERLESLDLFNRHRKRQTKKTILGVLGPI